MRLIHAIKEAEKEGVVKDILGRKGYLCSAYVMLRPGEEIDGWELGFYDPPNGKITPVSVGETVKVGEPDEPLRPDIHTELKGSVRIPSAKALAAAKKEAEKHSLPIERIIFSLRKRECFEWSAIFITRVVSMITVRIDAESGEVLENSVESLLSGKGPTGQAS